MTSGPTVADAVREAEARLASAGCDSPRLDAEVLAAHALGTDRAGLVRRGRDPLEGAEADRIEALIARREAREPVSTITGRRWFRNLELHVTRDVLAPRPETELLVEWALGLPEGARVADVGTGSGAIALALADERPDLSVIATDVDPSALAVAIGNAGRLGLDVAFAQGDLLDSDIGRLDAVVSNLPYIPESEWCELQPEVRDHEPRIALTPGPDGLELVERLVGDAAVRGIEAIALEIGAGQAGRTAGLLAAHGWQDVSIVDDLAGIGRMVCSRTRGVSRA